MCRKSTKEPGAFRKTLSEILAALIIGMAAGFRGNQELERPWAEAKTSLSDTLTGGGDDEENMDEHETP